MLHHDDNRTAKNGGGDDTCRGPRVDGKIKDVRLRSKGTTSKDRYFISRFFKADLARKKE